MRHIYKRFLSDFITISLVRFEINPIIWEWETETDREFKIEIEANTERERKRKKRDKRMNIL